MKLTGLRVRTKLYPSRFVPLIPIVLVVGLYLVAAEINALQHPGSRVFPNFAQILTGARYSIIPDAINGRIRILDDTLASLSRLVAGLALSSIFATGLAMTLFAYASARRMFFPLFLLTAKVPMVAALPLVLIWIGVGESSRIFLIYLGVVPILTVQCVDFLDASYARFGLALDRRKIPLSHQIYFIWLPRLLPALMRFLQANLGLAWLYLFIAETFGASSGLGYRVSILRTRVWMDVTLVYLIWIGVISLLLYYALSGLKRGLEGPTYES